MAYLLAHPVERRLLCHHHKTQAGPVIELAVFYRRISLFAGEYGWEFFCPFE